VIPDDVTYLGAAVILTGALWLALREAQLKKPVPAAPTTP
jgi:hypothetical protein